MTPAENFKPMTVCADRLGKAWDHELKITAVIVIPIALLTGLLDRHEWIVFSILTIFGAFRTVGFSRTAFRDRCPFCGAEGKFDCFGRQLTFTCPACREDFETDCEMHYSGARPAKALRLLPRHPAP